MEQFKVCEKETKTKTYSKEGLAREAKRDPHEVAQQATRAWLREMALRLQSQVDAAEADVEKLGKGRGARKHRDEIAQLEASIRRHRWHVARLEQIARLLDNRILDHARVDEVREGDAAGDERRLHLLRSRGRAGLGRGLRFRRRFGH